MEPHILLLAVFILISVAFGDSGISPSQDGIPNIVTNITLNSSSIKHQNEYAQLQSRLDRQSRTWDGNHPRHRLLTALYGFSRYKERHLADVNRLRSLYKNVSKKQRATIESAVKYTHKLHTVADLIDVNESLAQKILQTGLQFYNVSRSELDAFIAEQDREGKSPDRTSVAQAMKHYVRDWAEEGREEREEAFGCLINQLEKMSRAEDAPLKVLVPGGGVGRLAHDIAGLGGFEVTMNEWSMYMNLVYRQLTHEPIVPNELSYHPWLDWWSHHATTADMLRSVSFPDTAIDNSAVLLVEGDFTTVFNGENGRYDVVATLFFIDTARNLLSYLETIHRLLRPGGIWLNLGPLLYGTAPFIQLSLDEIIALAEKVGFRIEDTDEGCGYPSVEGLKVRAKEVAYGRNPRGLGKNAYLAQSWRAVKI